MAHVLIVGAGPAGASLAYLLARRGIQVTLLERHHDFEREFRGEVLMPSGLEAFDQMGLTGSLSSVPTLPLPHLAAYLFGRKIFDTGPVGDAFPGPPPSWVSQPRLLEALVSEAGRFPGFRLERGARVRALVRDAADRVVGVSARIADRDHDWLADLVVGADGRASIVRKQSRVGVRTDRVRLDVVWARIPMPSFMADEPHLRIYLGHGHLLIVAPTPENALQLGWVIRKGAFGALRSRGVHEWLETLADYVSPDLAEHLRAHSGDAVRPFLLDAVSDRVDTWNEPGMLLIGDAAHTMSPVGAQGLNIAIRDAVVAANELVPACEARNLPAAIDAAGAAVETERIPEVRLIQRMQALPPHVVLSRAWWSPYVLRAVIPRVIGRGGGGIAFQRFAYGVTEVKLRV